MFSRSPRLDPAPASVPGRSFPDVGLEFFEAQFGARAQGLEVLRNPAGHRCAELRARIEAHRRALRTGTGILKNGSRTAVTRVDAAGDEYCVKEYLRRGWLERLKSAVRGPRGELAWRAGQCLLAEGLATAELVALVRARPCGQVFLITRFVHHAVPLALWLRDGFISQAPAERVAARRALARALGRWTKALHGSALYHNDLSAKNLLAQETKDGWRFLLIDLESISRLRAPGRRRRVKNLAQLIEPSPGLTRTDRHRLLLAYSEGLSPRARRRLLRDVDARVRYRRGRRNRRLARASPGLDDGSVFRGPSTAQPRG